MFFTNYFTPQKSSRHFPPLFVALHHFHARHPLFASCLLSVAAAVEQTRCFAARTESGEFARGSCRFVRFAASWPFLRHFAAWTIACSSDYRHPVVKPCFAAAVKATVVVGGVAVGRYSS